MGARDWTRRRALLAGGAAGGVLGAPLLAGCATETVHGASKWETFPFALGVASGDPGRDGFVIWTRLVGRELSLLDHDRSDVRWEVASDEQFANVAAQGVATATRALAHSIHIDVRHLRSGRPYWYRFHAGDATSRVGRARTIDPAASHLKVALVACQHWEHGWFSVYRDIVSQDPDFVIHAGDYIYEKSFGQGPNVRAFPLGDPSTLEEYRLRHALYKTDEDLQSAHAQLPFVVSFDDHEVENDYAGVDGVASSNREIFALRRAAAYQAYYEHMPLRPSAWRGNGVLQMYRSMDLGPKARLIVLDTRQFRSTQPCGGELRGAQLVGPCAGLMAQDQTMLGMPQQQWLRTELTDASVEWALIVQQSLFAPLNLGSASDRRLWSDLWDGYPNARREVLDAIRASPARNTLVLGGDVHSFWLNELKEDYSDPLSPIIATEIVTGCLASRNAPEALFANARANKPHVRYFDNAGSGYVLARFEGSTAEIQCRKIGSLLNPKAACTAAATFTIDNRGHGGG